MGRMSELDAEIRQNADQQEETKTVTSSLREAAQAVIYARDEYGYSPAAEIIRARGEHMTDRELLEAAAKAVGYEYSEIGGGSRHDPKPGIIQPYVRWNPLTDDGDALQLAVQLELQITVGVIGCRVNNWNSSVRCVEENRTDLCAATRRAIVRAAAEFGRGQV